MNNKGKDVKKSDAPSNDPQIRGFNPDEFFGNQLSISKELQMKLTEEGMSWRFINAAQFRSRGNNHGSHWQPYKTDTASGANSEGLIARGDLILAVRPKQVTDAHRKFLKQRNNLQKAYNKTVAQDLKKMARDAGVGSETRIHEGYEENE